MPPVAPFLPLLLGCLALTLPAPGRTAVVEAELQGLQAWTLEIGPTGPEAAAQEVWLLLELTGDDRADLDLEVRVPDALVRRAASHRSRERLLVPLPAHTGLTVAVTARRPGGSRALRLAVSALVEEAPLGPGGTLRGEGGARAHLVPLAAPPGCLELALGAEAGEADLLVLDRRQQPLATNEGPGPERTALDPGPAACAVVLLGPDARGWSLSLAQGPGLEPAPLDRFLAQLSSTPEQQRALEALRTQPDWVAIRGYLDRYPRPEQLELRVIPGLRARGVERFGGFSAGVLAINPTIAGHQENVQELVDTLMHELVHALLALPREEPFPLADDVLDSTHDPELASLAGRTIRRGNVPEPLASYLEQHYGPSASDPRRDWSDINAAAQELVSKVVEADLAATGVGRETLVFENIRRRQAGKK